MYKQALGEQKYEISKYTVANRLGRQNYNYKLYTLYSSSWIWIINSRLILL